MSAGLLDRPRRTPARTAARAAARTAASAAARTAARTAAAIAADRLDPPRDPNLAALERDPETWLRTLFPGYVSAPMGPHHQQFWQWLWAIEEGVSPVPFVGIWNRGGAKSTSAELGTVALAARRRRRYALYVSGTQDRADDHVQTIAGVLESRAVSQHYPDLADRAVNKYGSSKGWRRNRLRTAAGFTIDALGLDVAARGAKLDEARPDLLVFDDVDAESDTPQATEKKIRAITHKIIPAGAADVAVVAIQNLIISHGVFAQMVDGTADFLARRILSGPIPALEGFAAEQQDDGAWKIVAGTPTWAGFDVPRCQALIDLIGISAFRKECQHEVKAEPGGMFDHLVYQHCTWEQVPDLTRVVVAADPAVTDTDQSDAQGIHADGLGVDGTIYRLWSWEQRTSPLDAIKRALRKAVELGADTIVVETDQGGDTWHSVYREAVRELTGEIERQLADLQASAATTGPAAASAGPPAGSPAGPVAEEIEDLREDLETLRIRPPRFKGERAGAVGSKTHRAGQMLTAYEQAGRMVHVLGTHHVLEAALYRFPLTKPLDLVDCSYWSWRELTGGRRARSRYRSRHRGGAQ